MGGQLRARYKGYRVESSHCETVGQALVVAMGDVLSPDFSDEAKDAWVKAYTVLAEIRIEAAVQPEPCERLGLLDPSHYNLRTIERAIPCITSSDTGYRSG